jgi:hypothetical protein
VLITLTMAASAEIGNLDNEGRFRESWRPKKTTSVTNIPKDKVIKILLSTN